MLKMLLTLALGLMLLTLNACSTVHGAGTDLKDASHATKDAIND